MSMVITFFQYNYEYYERNFRKYTIFNTFNFNIMGSTSNRSVKYIIIILLTMFLTTLYHDETTPPCTPYYNDDGDIVWQHENYWE